MNELFNVLTDILVNGKAPKGITNVKIEEDKDGNVTIKYTNPANNAEIKKIRKELDAIDDEIFSAAAEKLMRSDRNSYNIMSNIEKPTDVAATKKAYELFKTCVTEVAEEEIKKLTDKVNYLFNKYLQK